MTTPSERSIGSRLSTDEAARYERDGYLVRERVFDAAEVAAITDACEDLVERLVRDRRGTRLRAGSYVFDPDLLNGTIIKWEGESDVVHGIEPFVHLSEPLRAWAADRRLLDPMKDLIPTDEPELFTEKLNLKRPHVGGANPLHQDHPYWVDAADDASEIATTILFLDDATLDNGCLWVVPGSHRDGGWTTRTGGDRFASFEIDTEVHPADDAVPLEVPAGSTVSFGPFMVHRSATNTSQHDRRALLYSYQPAGRRHQLENLRRLQPGSPMETR